MTKIRSTPSRHPFAARYSAITHVKDPEGWVRGKASLNTETGEVKMVLGLETDSTLAGVKGRMKVRVLDEDKTEIAVVKMKHEVGIPGKTPGRARSEEFRFSKQIPVDIAARADSLDVDVEFTGAQPGFWGIPLDVVIKAIEVVVSALQKRSDQPAK